MISADTAIKTMIIVLLAARSVLLTLLGYVAQKLNAVLKTGTIWKQCLITVTLIFAMVRPLLVIMEGTIIVVLVSVPGVAQKRIRGNPVNLTMSVATNVSDSDICILSLGKFMVLHTTCCVHMHCTNKLMG